MLRLHTSCRHQTSLCAESTELESGVAPHLFLLASSREFSPTVHFWLIVAGAVACLAVPWNTKEMQNGGDYLPPIISNTSLFIPYPVSIYVTANTFVRYNDDRNGGSDSIGMIIKIYAEEERVQIRCFLTWVQLVQHIGPERIGNVSFWRRRNAIHPPFYLCDSDIVVDITTSSIKGLAFVFHESDNVLRQLDGIANTFIVSSIYLSRAMMIRHSRTFFSFPCQQNLALPTCFSSMIFEQLLMIKNKLQLALNTRSMVARNVQTIHLDNINRLTWHYMTRNAVSHGVEIGSSYGTVKVTFMEGDSCITQKWRDIQETFSLCRPEHFQYARLLFGASVGLGVRAVIPLSLRGAGRLERVENFHQISIGDTINVVTFRNQDAESLKRGFFFRYMPSTCTLSITIRFTRINQQNDIKRLLRVRRIAVPSDDTSCGSEDVDDVSISTDEGDVWPLHSDTEIQGSKVSCIDIGNQLVTTENQIIRSINVAINIINDMLQ